VQTKLRIAVVSPFLDRRHGTERCMVEQIEHLARNGGWEVHLYAQRVEDLRTTQFGKVAGTTAPAGAVFWHPVPSIPGPHLLRFLWWLAANQFARWRDARFRGLRFDLVYSPGVNCFDADAVAVHACFSALEERSRTAPTAGEIGFRGLARRAHRALYYALVASLERRLYSRRKVALAAVSRHTAQELERRFQRNDVRVIPNAVDLKIFHPAARLERRSEARKRLGYAEHDFVVLLIGNDWRMKGLPTLIEALARCEGLPLRLLVVGQEDPNGYLRRASQLGVSERLQFAPLSADVLGFYAAADAYASPSLEDAFALPPLEAMACGLPVIASRRAGVSEIIRNGENGFCLQDPENAHELGDLLRRLYAEPDLRVRMGEEAARTAQSETWDRNAALTWNFLRAALEAKRRPH
jgi:UDP-glucose:(heptosyl)LPS alpha-1,3-glucosyltransferase